MDILSFLQTYGGPGGLAAAAVVVGHPVSTSSTSNAAPNCVKTLTASRPTMRNCAKHCETGIRRSRNCACRASDATASVTGKAEHHETA